MTDTKQNPPMPPSDEYFLLTFGNLGDAIFQVVIGLDLPYDASGHYSSASPYFPTMMPGVKASLYVTLKSVVFTDNMPLFHYFTNDILNNATSETVILRYMDKQHKPMFSWTLKNAVVKQVVGFDFHSAEIRELVLAFDAIQMT